MNTIATFLAADLVESAATRVANATYAPETYAFLGRSKARISTTFCMSTDVPDSNVKKAISHWVEGDFGYVARRAFESVFTDHSGSAASRDSRSFTLLRSDLGALGSHIVSVSGLARPVEVFEWAPSRIRAHLEETHTGLAALSSSEVAIAGAAYLDDRGRPTGFFATRGSTRNSSRAPNQGGLVVISENRGVQRLDILDISLGGSLPGTAAPVRPFRRLRDFQNLRRWITGNRASAFQTIVLYADGTPRIAPPSSSGASGGAPRERRLLVTYTIAASEDAARRYAIVNIPSAVRLYDAMLIAHGAVDKIISERTPPNVQRPRIEGIANLDTGVQDVLVVRRASGATEQVGKRPLSFARAILRLEQLD